MKTELCLIICFITGVLIFYLLKQSCGCGSIEGNGGGTPDDGSDEDWVSCNDCVTTYLQMPNANTNLNNILSFCNSSDSTVCTDIDTIRRLMDKCYGINCGGHGNCVSGICECNDGWSGEYCGTDLCDNIDCGGHGNCVSGICECNDGWSGQFCQVNDCDNIVCGKHGSCVSGACVCDENWLGDDCCTPNGTALSTGITLDDENHEKCFSGFQTACTNAGRILLQDNSDDSKFTCPPN